MVIINPFDDSVLTLKPDMIAKTFRHQYTMITYKGVVYDPNETPHDTNFVINLNYDDFISKLEKGSKFIIAQWKEI